jgi:hypothetical protein
MFVPEVMPRGASPKNSSRLSPPFVSCTSVFPSTNSEEGKTMMMQKVNAEPALRGQLEAGAPIAGVAPVMATPALIATPVIAKAAGAVVGAGAVAGAAYVAYKTAGG